MSDTFFCGPFLCRSIYCTNGILLIIRFKEALIDEGIKLTFEDDPYEVAQLYLEDRLRDWLGDVTAILA